MAVLLHSCCSKTNRNHTRWLLNPQWPHKTITATGTAKHIPRQGVLAGALATPCAGHRTLNSSHARPHHGKERACRCRQTCWFW